MTQHSTRNMSDAKNTLWGKCLSVFISFAFAASTVSVAPVASALADEVNGDEQNSVMEEVSSVLTDLQEESNEVVMTTASVDDEGDGNEIESTETDVQSEDGIETQSEEGGIMPLAEEGEGAEQPEEPIIPTVEFSEGVLNITGPGEITGAMVSAYKGAASTVVIDGATNIAQEAFAEFKMTDLTIMNVANIGYAFRSCTNLKTLTIVNVDNIDTNAFYNPAGLKTVYMKNVSAMGENVFSVYGGVTALESVTLEDVNVGNRAFAEHKNLSSVSFTEVGSIGFQAFMNCQSLTEVDLSGVGTVGTSAFLGCTGLTELNIGSINVENTAFYGCTGLKTVNISNIKSLGDQAFYGCSSLEEVSFEGDLPKVGSSVFINCPDGQIKLKIENAPLIPEQAFVGANAIKTIEINNVKKVGTNAFASCKSMTTASMTDVKVIGTYAFYKCTGLTSVKLLGVTDTIENYAFWNCSNLKTIDSLENVSGSIGGFAFYGCKSLTGVTVADAVKMGYIGSNKDLMDRVVEILAGKFKLENADEIKELIGEAGWTVNASNKTENWNSYENGRQLLGQARWQSADDTKADVKIDAYYTAQRQMDYVFVADLSASMAQLGNPDDKNARFYDMQSKLLDMTDKLLGTDGYDCRISIVTFGGMHQTETCKTMPFSSDATEVANYIKALEPLNEQTDYGMGLKAALDVVKGQQEGRDTVVVFLSDGYPTVDNYNDGHGTVSASAIKELGVDIYGVLHSPTSAQHDSALKIMHEVCNGEVFESTDTGSFGDAMNAAFAAAYGNNTVTIPVNDAEFNVEDLSATEGEVTYENGVITWKLKGMPFTTHSLTYTMELKDVPNPALLPVGTHYYNYVINSGSIDFGNGNDVISISQTLMLPERTVTVFPPQQQNPSGDENGGDDDGNQTTGGQTGTDGQGGAGDGAGDGATAPTLPVIIPDAVTPLAAAPVAAPAIGGGAPAAAAPAAPAAVAPVATIADDANPLAAPEETTIEDDENALIGFDEPECQMHWLVSLGLLITLIYGFFVIKRRKDENDELASFEHSVTHRR